MINTAEKIETIVMCRSSGTYGEFVEFAPGKYRITADNFTVLVRCDELGWHVSACSFEGIDRELYVAAQMALDAVNGRGPNLATKLNLSAFCETWS